MMGNYFSRNDDETENIRSLNLTASSSKPSRSNISLASTSSALSSSPVSASKRKKLVLTEEEEEEEDEEVNQPHIDNDSTSSETETDELQTSINLILNYTPRDTPRTSTSSTSSLISTFATTNRNDSTPATTTPQSKSTKAVPHTPNLIESSKSRIKPELVRPSRKKMKSTANYIYNTLFVNGENSDICVRALNREWHLHKLYLCQSPYFESMFKVILNQN